MKNLVFISVCVSALVLMSLKFQGKEQPRNYIEYDIGEVELDHMQKQILDSFVIAKLRNRTFDSTVLVISYFTIENDSSFEYIGMKRSFEVYKYLSEWGRRYMFEIVVTPNILDIYDSYHAKSQVILTTEDLIASEYIRPTYKEFKRN